MDTKKWIQRVAAVCFFLAAAFLGNLFFGFIGDSGSYEKSDVLLLEKGWEVRIDDDIYTDVDLRDFSFSVLGKGDEITMTTTLPESLGENSTLRLLIYLSKVSVYVNDYPVYHYGTELDNAGKLVGSGYHFIQLPRNSAGKKLTLVIEPTENNAITSVHPLRVTSTSQAYSIFLYENKLSLFIGLFLALLGFILTLASAGAYFFNKEYLRLVWIGFFSALMGGWTLCNSKAIQLMSSNLAMNTFLEYLFLYFAPIPFCLIMIDTRREIPQWRKRLMYILTVICICFAFITLLLQVTDVIHYPATVVAFHVVGAIALTASIVLTLYKLRDLRLSDMIMYAGIAIMCIFVALDLFRFNIQKYLISHSEILSESVLPIGTLLFVVIIIVSYLTHLYDKVLTKAEQELLEKRAYEDALTGLYNRSKCELMFEKLDASDADYAMISFDMNGLKKTNDTYGHVMGDQLLTTFADVLKTVYSKYATVIRMGGDEFLVLVEEHNLPKIDKLMERYLELTKKTQVPTGGYVSASYGICWRNELENATAETVYVRADNRMYEMKQRFKAEVKN